MPLPSTGLIARFDPSDTSLIGKNFDLSNPPSSGEQMRAWGDVGDTLADCLASADGTGTDTPTWVSGGFNGRGCLRFDGLGQWLVGTDDGASGTYSPFGDFVTGSAFDIWIAVVLTGPGGSSSVPPNNPPILSASDASDSFVGLFLRSTGGQHFLQFLNTTTTSQDYDQVEVALNTKYVMRLTHASGVLSLDINNGQITGSVASGATDPIGLAHNLHLGLAENGLAEYLSMSLGELVFYSAALTGSDESDAWAYFLDRWVTPPPVNFTWERSITIDHTKCGASDLTNFPLLVYTADASAGVRASLKSVANGGQVESANGWDIYFYADAALTTRLAAERVNYDPTTGIGEWWVRIPTLSTSTDTVIYIAYGEASIAEDPNNAAVYGTQAVWDADFVGVWHLGDGTAHGQTDSTQYGNNWTGFGGITPVAGKVGGAESFGGASDFIWVGGNAFPTADITISAWGKTTSAAAFQEVFSRYTAGGGFLFGMEAGGGVEFDGREIGGPYLSSGVAGVGYNDGAWHYFAGRRAGNVFKAWIDDGTDVASAAQGTGLSMNNTAVTPTIGNDAFNDVWGDALDEVRISTAARSDDWLITEYHNQNIPDKNTDANGFYTFGAETTPPAPSGNLVAFRPVLGVSDSPAPPVLGQAWG